MVATAGEIIGLLGGPVGVFAVKSPVTYKAAGEAGIAVGGLSDCLGYAVFGRGGVIELFDFGR